MSISSNEYLQHIRDELVFILKHTEQLEYYQFLNDEVLLKAVVRSLEIIGEASKNIDSKLRDDYSHVEWTSMSRTRDKLIHHYFGVDYEIVWNIIVDKLPTLFNQIEDIIEDEEN